MTKVTNRYSRIIETIFRNKYVEGSRNIPFKRDDLVTTAQELKIMLPKNLGDIVYSFRYRTALPDFIRERAPDGEEWVIRPIGQSKYQFSLTAMARIIPNPMLSETKIPDSTPGIITRHAFNDEQGLLAKLRYNRLIDIFTGITCYSLQNHLRTTVPNVGQVETDEIYVGVDKRGVQYIFPVQAKGGSDQLGIIQIEQDFALCSNKFPTLICVPIAAQFIDASSIALFSFEESEAGIGVSDEKHYRLVPPEQLTDEDLSAYRNRT